MEHTQSVWKNVGRLASTIKFAVKINMTLLCSAYMFIAIPLCLALSGIFSGTMGSFVLLDIAVAIFALFMMILVSNKVYAYTQVISFLSWASREDGLPKDWSTYRDFLLHSKKVAAEEKSRWTEAFSQQQSAIRTTYSTREFFGTTMPVLLNTAKQIGASINKTHEPCMTHADAIKERLDQFMSLPQSIAPPLMTFGAIAIASLILMVLELLPMAVL